MMTRFARAFFMLMTMLLGLLPATNAMAEAGKPVPWQIGFQESVTPVMDMLTDLHDLLLVIIVAISLFVMALMGYVMFRFSEKRNPTPSKTTHNTLIEVIWTGVPVLILIVIAVPALRGLYYMDKTKEADMTLKVVGRQWYWSYEYPDHGGIMFDSYMIQEENLKEDDIRLLSVDNRVVVPVDTTVRVLVTGADVLHNWAMPSFGIKMDAVPGRLNETWFEAKQEGTYYGQCSELCGVGHGFMPIAVEVVSQDQFDAWVEEAKQEFATRDARNALALAAQTTE